MRRRLILQPTAATNTKTLSLKPGMQTLKVTEIRPREADTRHLNPKHVVALAESIAALGLLEPVVVDMAGNLLAGAHRLAACQLLAIADNDARRESLVGRLRQLDEDEQIIEPDVATSGKETTDLGDATEDLDHDAWAAVCPQDKIPVQVMDLGDEKGRALAIEIAENAQRRQYSAPEVKSIAQRLQKAGYTFKNGRPRKGEKSGKLALAAIVGLSIKQVGRLQGSDATEAKPVRGQRWQAAVKRLTRAANKALEAGKGRRGEEAEKIKAAIEALLAVTSPGEFE